jgi:hypothetical protein
MKYRYGFVANSSSSSFLVAFPRTPTSAAEVQHILFGRRKYVTHKDMNGKYTATELAARIFTDIQTKKITYHRAIQELAEWYCLDAHGFTSGPSCQQEYPREQRRARFRDYLIGAFDATGYGEYSYFDLAELRQAFGWGWIWRSTFKAFRTAMEQHLRQEVEHPVSHSHRHDYRQDAYTIARNAWMQRHERFLQSDHLYLVEYSDNENGPINAFLEHGDVFRALPHLILSKH